MAKEPDTFLDKVNKVALRYNRRIVGRLVEMVPRPPGLRKLSQREQLAKYMTMMPQEMEQLRVRHGDAAYWNYRYRMEKLKERLGSV